jgi:Gluconate 2-dehydrogenase subunit 3
LARESKRNRSASTVLEPPANFYSMLRWLTLTAYYTSEAGATQELHYQIIPDRFDACAEVQLSKLQLSTEETKLQ